MNYETIKKKAALVKRLEAIESDLQKLEEIAGKVSGGDLSGLSIRFDYVDDNEDAEPVDDSDMYGIFSAFVVRSGRVRASGSAGTSIALNEYTFLRALDGLWKGMMDEREELLEAIA